MSPQELIIIVLLYILIHYALRHTENHNGWTAISPSAQAHPDRVQTVLPNTSPLRRRPIPAPVPSQPVATEVPPIQPPPIQMPNPHVNPLDQPNTWRQNPRYRVRDYPNVREAACSAIIWDEIAARRQIRYYFVGNFAAHLFAPEHETIPIYRLEIVVDRQHMANPTLLDDLSQASAGRLIIDQNGNDTTYWINLEPGAPQSYVIQAVFITSDGDWYPDLSTPSRTALGTLDYAHEFAQLPDDPQHTVPVLRCHMQLRQKLLRYERVSLDHREARKYKNHQEMAADIGHIRHLLRHINAFDYPPYFQHDIVRLTEIVKSWIKFADKVGAPITREELAQWSKVGIWLEEQDTAIRT